MSNEPFAVADPPATRRTTPELDQSRFRLRVMAIALFTACGLVGVLLVRLNIENRKHKEEIKQYRTMALQQEAKANGTVTQARAAVQWIYLLLADDSRDPQRDQIPAWRRRAFLNKCTEFFESLDRDNDLDEMSQIALARILKDMGDVHQGLEEYELAEDAYARSLARYGNVNSKQEEKDDIAKRLDHVKEIIKNLPPSEK